MEGRPDRPHPRLQVIIDMVNNNRNSIRKLVFAGKYAALYRLVKFMIFSPLTLWITIIALSFTILVVLFVCCRPALLHALAKCPKLTRLTLPPAPDDNKVPSIDERERLSTAMLDIAAHCPLIDSVTFDGGDFVTDEAIHKLLTYGIYIAVPPICDLSCICDG
jgi:hypothetical protein